MLQHEQSLLNTHFSWAPAALLPSRRLLGCLMPLTALYAPGCIVPCGCCLSACELLLTPSSPYQAGKRHSCGVPGLQVGAPQESVPSRPAPRFKTEPNAARQEAGDEQSQSQPQLHPSWAAKQKEKQGLLSATPAGSKTVFNDDAKPLDIQPKHASAPPAKPSQKLHPSWEAKQKLAEKLKQLPSPTGTKLRFDDD